MAESTDLWPSVRERMQMAARTSDASVRSLADEPCSEYAMCVMRVGADNTCANPGWGLMSMLCDEELNNAHLSIQKYSKAFDNFQ